MQIGILFINIGTPHAPTEEAVREYLAEFLSDPYLIDYPRWLWMPILNWNSKFAMQASWI